MSSYKPIKTWNRMKLAQTARKRVPANHDWFFDHKLARLFFHSIAPSTTSGISIKLPPIKQPLHQAARSKSPNEGVYIVYISIKRPAPL